MEFPCFSWHFNFILIILTLFLNLFRTFRLYSEMQKQKQKTSSSSLFLPGPVFDHTLSLRYLQVTSLSLFVHLGYVICFALKCRPLCHLKSQIEAPVFWLSFSTFIWFDGERTGATCFLTSWFSLHATPLLHIYEQAVGCLKNILSLLPAFRDK